MKTLSALAFCALLLTECGGEAGPPEILYGADVCSQCRMIVSDERHAGAARGPQGEEARFDDVGCLVDFLAARRGQGWTAWVHDQVSGEPLAADAVWLARDPAGGTPMGSGLHAFAHREDAEAFAQRYAGQVEGRFAVP